MNICYVHSADFTKHKGSSIHVKELVRNLSLLHTIVLVVDKWDGSFMETVTILEMNCPRFLKIVWRTVFSAVYAARALLFSDINLLYAKSPLEGVILCILGKIFNVPVVYEVNGLIKEESKMKNENRFRVVGSVFLEYVVVNCADHLICVTPWIKENLVSRGISAQRLSVVENGADTVLFQYIDNARTILGLDPDKYYVGYTGTLKAWQGLEYILDAVPFILERELETEFLIVGGGELYDWLHQSIREKTLSCITVTGEVKHEKVPLYISACDVCLLLKKPLSSGYSPLKLYEYMGCERPVVASAVKGFECLEKEKAGILVNQTDPEEVADAVIMLLRDKILRKEMGKRGREYVVKNHTWEKVAQKISDICTQTVHKKR
ncbi:MAG: glycosyltransferase family 4 protein [Theionarchaea archaeon]|nr:glycosyltransferase family 4 protein [Theionarchaea archaeon]